MEDDEREQSVPAPDDVAPEARIACLERDLAAARERLAWALAELSDAAAEARHSQEHAETSRRRSHMLAALYDVACRLHLAPDRAELILAIGQLVHTHVGLPGWALFELCRGSGTMGLVAHAGVTATPWLAVRVGQGSVGRVAESGRRVVYAGVQRRGIAPPHEELLAACFPLRVDSETTGAFAVFRAPDAPERVPTSDELIVLDAIALHTAPLLCTARDAPPRAPDAETRRPPRPRR